MQDLLNVKMCQKVIKKGASLTPAVDRERYKFPPNSSNCQNVLHRFQVTDLSVYKHNYINDNYMLSFSYFFLYYFSLILYEGKLA